MNSTIEIARSRFLVGIILMLLVAFAGCGGGDEETQQAVPGENSADAPTSGRPAPTAETAGHPGTTIAGVTYTVPSKWLDIGPTGMRQAQYRLGPVDGDSAEGEVNVFYFGPTSGGGVEANLSR